MIRPLLLASLATLAACGKPADEGATLTVNAGDGRVKGAVDGASGAVKIDVPGFKGELALPKIKLDADNFELNGVNLYPGSKIDAVNVGGGGGDEGVRLTFTSPATPAKVREWFQGRLRTAGFTLRSEGDALVGETDDNKPFRMDLAPKGADAASGTIVIGG